MLGAPKSALVFITAASPFLIGAVHPERPPPWNGATAAAATVVAVVPEGQRLIS